MSHLLYRLVVARARKIILDPERWTSRELARGPSGTPVEPTDREAERFCAVGALMRAASDLEEGDERQAGLLAYETHLAVLQFAGIPEGQTTLEVINDRQGHEAVLRLFKDYITTH
jgi:hypothetical protein